MTIQEKLKHHIKSQGLVIRVLAERSNIPERKLYRLISGETKLTTDDFEKICRKGLAVDPSIFL